MVKEGKMGLNVCSWVIGRWKHIVKEVVLQSDPPNQSLNLSYILSDIQLAHYSPSHLV